jgi:hypothetical protein
LGPLKLFHTPTASSIAQLLIAAPIVRAVAISAMQQIPQAAAAIF